MTKDARAVRSSHDAHNVLARLEEHVAMAALEQPTVSQLVARLEAQGIGVKANVAATGRVAGISFALEGIVFKGSELGRAYSWQGLQRVQGVRYEPGRDLAALQAASARVKAIVRNREVGS